MMEGVWRCRCQVGIVKPRAQPHTQRNKVLLYSDAECYTSAMMLYLLFGAKLMFEDIAIHHVAATSQCPDASL